jgi:hypothetical protein
VLAGQRGRQLGSDAQARPGREARALGSPLAAPSVLCLPCSFTRTLRPRAALDCAVRSCTKKIVVTLSVPTGQSLQTQSLQVTLSQVRDGSDVKVLQQPLEIALTKSPVWSVYPLCVPALWISRPFCAC